MVKHESKFGLQFRAWWRSKRLLGSFELKDTRGASSLPFSEVKEEQIDSGYSNKGPKGNLVRVQSGTVGTGDYLGLVSFPSYVVIKYPGHFEVIDIETFDMERKRSVRKSLTGARAKEISIISVDTKN